MKNLSYLLFINLLLISCSNDDEQNNQIIGEWKLNEVQIYGVEGQSSIDYSSENIIYNFQSNEILIVTGGQNEGYPTGEYEYIFEEDYLSGYPSQGESKGLLVKINNSKWTYDFSNGIMKLGKSYVDGPDLFFERK